MRTTPITVTSMLSVITPGDLIIVPVCLDTLEMEEIALVITCFYRAFSLTWPASMKIYCNKEKRQRNNTGGIRSNSATVTKGITQ